MDTQARTERMKALHQQWKIRHTCGVGSRPENVRNATRILKSVIYHLHIHSMLDAGCGDQSWVHEAVPGDIEYFGMDLVPWNDQVEVGDFVSDPLPAVDLIFCRTVLIHLDPADVMEALTNFKMKGQWLLATHNPIGDNKGRGLPVGEAWNLSAEPFSLTEPLVVWPDCSNFLALWGLRW